MPSAQYRGMYQSRMKYDPDIHNNRNKSYTTDDIMFICSRWDFDKKRDIAYATGRTEASLTRLVGALKKSGEFESYRKKGELA